MVYHCKVQVEHAVTCGNQIFLMAKKEICYTVISLSHTHTHTHTHTHSYSHTHTLLLTHTHSYSHTHTPERNVFTMYVAIWSFLSDVFSLLYTLLVTHTFGIIIYYQVMICKKDQEILMIIRDSFPVSAAVTGREWAQAEGIITFF